MSIKKPIVLYSGQLSELQAGDSLAGGSGVIITSGMAVVDFGSIPGTNFISVDVSDVNALTTSTIFVEFFYNGSTTHNMFEHFFIRKYAVVNCNCDTNGQLAINVLSDLRLTGSFTVKYTIFN